jgi:hypothetical protein
LGKLFFGRIKKPYLKFPILHKLFPKFPLHLSNSGRKPFSEPETQAIRDLMNEIEKHDFSFYLTCHTAVHNIVTPWKAKKPPFKQKNSEEHVHNYVKKWVAKNTEYEDTNLWYFASGTSTDWCFKEFRVPSFTFEILSTDYEPGSGGGKHDHLVHWMKTTIPVFMYLLANIEKLNRWETPDIQPILPEGIPPEPLN